MATTAAAQAQSFDCKKAATATEKLICANKPLCDLDLSLAAAIKEAIAKAPEHKKRILADEREWVALRDKKCAGAAQADEDSATSFLGCLTGAYLERRRELLDESGSEQGDNDNHDAAQYGPASFDCANAKAPREKLICADRQLADLDGKIGRLYQQKKAQLSAHGAELLQRSESTWLRYIDVVCAIDDSTARVMRGTPTNCLLSHYRGRIEQLTMVAEKIGPYVFNRVDLFSAKNVEDDGSGRYPGVQYEEVSFPQIDNMKSAAVDAWNKKAERSLCAGDDCSGTDHTVAYTIGYATDKLISFSTTDWEYGHGAAHGIWSVENSNFIMSPSLRELRESDIFKIDGVWRKKIGELLLDALHADGWSAPEGREAEVNDEMRARATSVDRWMLTPAGIEIGFSAYEGGCYPCTPGSATIKWADLKPFIDSQVIIP